MWFIGMNSTTGRIRYLRIFANYWRMHQKISERNFATAAVSTSQRLEESMGRTLKPVIGLEIHAQIDAKTKLFSGAASNYWASSNTMVHFFDCALPGTLPVLNRRCVEAGVMTALTLNSQINLVSMFDRKHYFYSDLPAGYQITQQRRPLAVNGWLDYIVYDEKEPMKPYLKRTAVTQIQLEHDSGKSIHDTFGGRSLVDLNRAGVALLEIVCHHDMENELEASCFARELHNVLKMIGVCQGKMERGQFRVDANVSVHRPGEPLGPRTEVKNLNSFRFIRRALQYEIERQTELVSAGKTVENETLTFDYRTGKTAPMRDKEVRQDYRYMPEPNLPPLLLMDSAQDGPRSKTAGGTVDVEDIRKRLQILPAVIRDMRMDKYGLTLEDCVVLGGRDILSHVFDQLITQYSLNGSRTVRMLALYAEAMNEAKIPLENSKISLSTLAELVELLQQDKISAHVAYVVLQALAKGNKKSPKEIVQERNLFVIDDESEMERVCDEVIMKHASLVKRYQKGEEKVFSRLIRSAGSKLNHRAPEHKLERILKAKIEK